MPPKYVRGTPGKVVGIEPHALEPPVEGRTSIVSHGVVVLHYMPQAVYVKMDDSDQVFLTADQRGVLAVTPQARPWTFKPAAGGPAMPVSRTQLSVLPRKQGTLHGIQGKTADPGFIVHWTFPPGPSSNASSSRVVLLLLLVVVVLEAVVVVVVVVVVIVVVVVVEVVGSR